MRSCEGTVASYPSVQAGETTFQSALDACVKGKIAPLISTPCKDVCSLPRELTRMSISIGWILLLPDRNRIKVSSFL